MAALTQKHADPTLGQIAKARADVAGKRQASVAQLFNEEVAQYLTSPEFPPGDAGFYGAALMAAQSGQLETNTPASLEAAKVAIAEVQILTTLIAPSINLADSSTSSLKTP